MMRHAIFLLLLVLAGATCVYGFDSVSANIPFAFEVADTTLPAGDYSVSPMLGFMRVQDLDLHGSAFGLTFWLQRSVVPEVIATWRPGASTQNGDVKQNASRGGSDCSIVFHRYGNRYFIAEVWLGLQGRGFSISKGERALLAAGMSPAVETLMAQAAK
jgi:hypothetical protein